MIARLVLVMVVGMSFLTGAPGAPASAAGDGSSSCSCAPHLRAAARASASTAALALSPGSGIQGERVTLTASVKPRRARAVVLQRKAGSRWVDVERARTSAEGTHRFRVRVRAATTSYRVKAPRVRQGGRVHPAETSPRRRLRTLRQSAALALPPTAERGGAVAAARGTFSPVRPRRPVDLEVRQDGSWVVVDSDRQSGTGQVSFVVPTDEVGAYEYRVAARSHRGAVPVRSASDTLQVVEAAPAPDADPPAPTGLTASVQEASVRLTWEPVGADDVVAYQIHAQPAGAAWQSLDQVPAEDTSYDAVRLIDGVEYSFAVVAVDRADNVSERSAPVTVTAVDTAPPAPGAVVGSGEDGAALLSWDAVPVPDVGAYHVWQVDPEEGGFDHIGTVTGTTFRVEGLVNGVEYAFAVSVVDETGYESERSEPVVVVAGTGPGAP